MMAINQKVGSRGHAAVFDKYSVLDRIEELLINNSAFFNKNLTFSNSSHSKQNKQEIIFFFLGKLKVLF